MTLLTTQTPEPPSGAIPIVLLFLLALIIFSMSKSRKKAKKERKEQMSNRQATIMVKMAHVNGLPIAENTSCTIYSVPGKYEIEALGSTFNLDKSKVMDVAIKTETEITKQYVSSVGGAVGGAVLFGPLGAMIGGRAKEKKTTETHKYLIFTYESDGEIKYVGFDATYVVKAYDFVVEFASSGTKHTATVNL